MNAVTREILNLNTWEALDFDHPAHRELQARERDRALETASLFKEAFGTDAGKRVLAILVEQTLARKVANDDSTMIAVGKREGQNDIVRQILQNIQLAEEGIRIEPSE